MSSTEHGDGSVVNKIAGLPKGLKRKRAREVLSTQDSDTESVGSSCTLNQKGQRCNISDQIDTVKGENVRFWTLNDDRALMTQLCNVRRKCAPYIKYKWTDPMMWWTITEKVNLSLKYGNCRSSTAFIHVEEVKDRARYYKNQMQYANWKLKIPCTELILLIEEAYRDKKEDNKGPLAVPKSLSSRLRSTQGLSCGSAQICTAAHSGYAQSCAILTDFISATAMHDLLQEIRGQLTKEEFFWSIWYIGSNWNKSKMCLRMSNEEFVLYLKQKYHHSHLREHHPND